MLLLIDLILSSWSAAGCELEIEEDLNCKLTFKKNLLSRFLFIKQYGNNIYNYLVRKIYSLLFYIYVTYTYTSGKPKIGFLYFIVQM